ncbi:MAG: lactonase family protein [Planctomycetes bacterium]|nr:lactonase family protein [Planctomycetota bacterium]
MPTSRTLPRPLCLAAALAGGMLMTVSAAAPAVASEKRPSLVVYVGTYTQGESRGIYVFRLNPDSGACTEPELVAECENPTFLAIHPTQRFLYAVNEIGEFQGEKTGAVTAFAIDRQTGKLTELNQQPSRGAGPCHIVVDREGRNVLVANYGGGSVAVLPIEDGGRLAPPSDAEQHAGSSVNPQRQKGPHAHSINLDPAGRFAFAADLGLDKVLVYRFDADQGTLEPHDPPFAKVTPGAGPRHFDFHPSGRFAWVINELDSTITGFRYDAERGTLETIETVSTLPAGYDGRNSTAEVRVHPSGRFLYGSNRGHHTLAVFRIDEKMGRLTFVEHEPIGGRTPRNFNVTPSGRFVLAAGQETDSIVVFAVDEETGALDRTRHALNVPTPVCIRFVEAAAATK